MIEPEAIQRPPDPFNHPPLVPGEWRLLRLLVQTLLAVAVLFGPSYVLSPPITGLAVGMFGVPLALIFLGWYVRRHVSRVLGTLLVFGMVVHLVGWVATYFYAFWLFRDL